MATGYEPLSLAYLIEISFIVNIAYHELKSYKLLDEIKGDGEKYLKYFLEFKTEELNGATIHGEENQIIEYRRSLQQLIDFVRGDGEGWEGNRRKSEQETANSRVNRRDHRTCDGKSHADSKWGGRRNKLLCFLLRVFYKSLLTGWDRRITEIILVGLVVTLSTLTVLGTLNLHFVYPNQWMWATCQWETCWYILFTGIFLTIVFPASWMILGRHCRRFVLGRDREEKTETSEKNCSGRLYKLGEDFTAKYKKFSVKVMDKTTAQVQVRPTP